MTALAREPDRDQLLERVLALSGRAVALLEGLAVAGEEAMPAAAALERRGCTVGEGLQAVEHLRRSRARIEADRAEMRQVAAELIDLADQIEPSATDRARLAVSGALARIAAALRPGR